MAALRSCWDPPYRSHHQQLVQPRRSPGDLPEHRRSRGVRTYDQPQPPHLRGMPSRLEMPQQQTYGQTPHHTGMRRYEQLIDLLDAATSRMESRCEEIDRRVKKLQASKAAHGRQPYAAFDSGVNNATWSPPPPPRSRPTCWDPPFRTHGRRVNDIRAPPLPEPPPQYTPTPFHQPPLVQTHKPTCWDPPGQRQSWGIAAHDQPYGVPPYAQQLQDESARQPSCRHPLSGTIKEDKDFRGEGERVDVELCYETELIPSHHSSSLDQELDAHHKMEKNNSLNRMSSFLDKVDKSKSSLLDDDYDNKATFDDDELIEMEHQSVKVSDDVDLNLEREGDSSSSPSCVDNSSQQRCWGSDDEEDVDGVDVSSQQHNLVQPMTMELERCEIGCLPTISEDSVTPKMIENLRPHKIDHTIRFKDVRDGIQRFYKSYTKEMRKQDILNYRASHAAICFLQLKETKPFTASKTRADSILPRFSAGKGRRDLEVVYVVAFDPGGKVSMLLLSSTLSVVPWFPP